VDIFAPQQQKQARRVVDLTLSLVVPFVVPLFLTAYHHVVFIDTSQQQYQHKEETQKDCHSAVRQAPSSAS
jgi:hypothetical protein